MTVLFAETCWCFPANYLIIINNAFSRVFYISNHFQLRKIIVSTSDKCSETTSFTTKRIFSDTKKIACEWSFVSCCHFQNIFWSSVQFNISRSIIFNIWQTLFLNNCFMVDITENNMKYCVISTEWERNENAWLFASNSKKLPLFVIRLSEEIDSWIPDILRL